MAITRKDIEHIAVLARLDMSGESFDRLAEDMQNIVGMVDQLQSLDLGDITDVINTERKNALREDVPVQEYTPEELVKPNAPDFQAGGVAVPRVVE
ncbi:MAG: Asp-tRNA(Asn)/Glu-tRNA(Gln) amidotransferase subunit GatC [Butyricicoccus sp.]